jgi:hypothetical protein
VRQHTWETGIAVLVWLPAAARVPLSIDAALHLEIGAFDINHDISTTYSVAASGESSHLSNWSRLVPNVPNLRRADAVMREASGPPSGKFMLRSCDTHKNAKMGSGYSIGVGDA